MATSSEDDIVDKVLGLVNEAKSELSTLDIASQLQVDHQRVVGAVKSIISQASCYTNSFLNATQKDYKKFELTPEGQLIAENGSHEARIVKQLIQQGGDGIDQQALLKTLPDPSMAKVGFSKAMSNGWIQIDKTTKLVTPKVTQIEDSVQKLVQNISKLSINELDKIDAKSIADMKKRKLASESLVKYMLISKGADFKKTIDKPETDLTAQLILSGEWKNKKFKDYNFDSLGVLEEKGHLHPLMKVREQFRQIFLEMGFAEMATNNFVESSFWNFDALIVPQAHPARDSQDTFFISNPKACKSIQDKHLVQRTKQSHEGNSDGSWPKGYQYDWSEEESSKNVLRTHTTAVTARVLYKLASMYKETSSFKPAKFFSIDRVFRNETLDATHLAEFNQVEGVVVDKNLTLGDLMGILQAFFEKLGIEQLRFKPAYNPYTEPSMEIFSFHQGLNKWVEVGNSGVFRPEMLSALGFPEDVTAIAWGLSLERPTMIKYKIDNIRELVGHKINLQMVYDNPICLF